MGSLVFQSVGCFRAVETADGFGDAGLPLDQILGEEAAAYCQFLRRCSPSAAYLESSCVARTIANGQPLADQVAADVDAGLVLYDPVQGEACVAALANTDCADLVATGRLRNQACAAGLTFAAWDCADSAAVMPELGSSGPAPCGAMFAGQVAGGESCSQSAECASAMCTGLAPTCKGTCVAWVEDGGDCSAQAACDVSGVCPPIAGICDRSQSLACVPFADGGARCLFVPGGPGYPCSATLPCQAGLTCDPMLSLCVGPGPGAPCDVTLGCQPGLQCDLTTSVCVPLSGVGVPCGGGCESGSFCASSGTCQPLVGDGGDCCGLTVVAQSPYLSAECAAGLVCTGCAIDLSPNGGVSIAETGHCLPPVDVGGSCAPPFASPSARVNVTGCLPGLACVGGTCSIPTCNATDGCCKEAGDCLSGTCDATGHCGPAPACPSR